MDAEGGCVVHRDRRTSKLAVVVAVQNMVVTACLLVTLYVYWDVKVKHQQTPTPLSDHAVHILFDTIADIPGGQKVKFGRIHSSSMMNLTDDTRIFVTCRGPYVLYMDVCYKNMGASNGTLELKVEGSETPLSIFKLHTLHADCRGLHSTVYLKNEAQASLYLNSPQDFKIKNISIGLNYMLASCEL